MIDVPELGWKALDDWINNDMEPEASIAFTDGILCRIARLWEGIRGKALKDMYQRIHRFHAIKHRMPTYDEVTSYNEAIGDE